jgi:hypothetical protein
MDIQEHRRSIAVFGASGHTGRFVVAQLLRCGFAPPSHRSRPQENGRFRISGD